MCGRKTCRHFAINNTNVNDSFFKVYAGIPQVVSLEKEGIPIDELYIYE